MGARDFLEISRYYHAKVPFSLFQQVRVSSLSDDMHVMRIRQQNCFVQCCHDLGGTTAVSPFGGESRRRNFDICRHSGFVAPLRDPTLRARGRGEGRVNGSERDVVWAAG